MSETSTAAEQAQISKTMAELKPMFPAMGEAELQAIVVAAKGNYNDALKRAFSPSSDVVPAANSIFAFFPKEGESSYAPSGGVRDSSALLGELQAKYGEKLENAKSALGDGYDDLQILLCFDKYHGDVKRAISDLLGQSSRSIERSQMSVSRDALRQSALLLTSGRTSLLTSSGIEELPVNLDLSLFGDDDLTEDEMSKPMAPLPPMLKPEDLLAQAALNGANASNSMDASVQEETGKRNTAAGFQGMDVIEQMLKMAYDELKENNPPETVVKPWPTVPEALLTAPVSVATAAPPVTRILDKSDLSKEDKHDANALQEFLAAKSWLTPSARSVATEEVKKISSDDFVVIAHVLRSLRQFQSARRDAFTKYGTADPALKKGGSSAANSKSKKDTSKPSVTSSHGSLGNSNGEKAGQEEVEQVPQEDTRAAPVSLIDLTDHIAYQLAMGADLASTVEMCSEMQENELVELEAILTADRIQISDSYPKIVSISLCEPSYRISKTISEQKLGSEEQSSAEFSTSVSFRNPLLLQLIVILPPLYPECAPIISVRTNSRSCPLTASDFARLEALLKSEASANTPMPCLFALEQAAEAFLMEDASIKASALRENAMEARKGNTAATNVDPHIYDSLKLIFSFSSDFVFHRFEDILNQRNKCLKRAIALLLNGPKASGLDVPIIRGEAKKFPILNLTGDVDITASLRLIGLSYAAVRVLLQSYDWKLKELSTAYLTSLSNNSYEDFLKRNGVVIVDSTDKNSSAAQGAAKQPLDEEVECPTCMVDYPRHQTFSLACGHFLCNSCYCDYVDVNISSGSAQAITCPAPGCKFILDPVSVMSLLSAKRWTTYSNMVVSHFVTTNKALSWCPSEAACDYVIQMEEFEDGDLSSGSSGSSKDSLGEHQHDSSGARSSNTPTLVQCKCSYTYCSRCKRPGGHFPASCSEIESWERAHPNDGSGASAEEEEATKRMLKSITRSCPRCGLSISKSGGCPHMSCAMCGHQFCWVCFANWESKHYACDQSEIAVMDEAKVANVRLHSIDALLVKHRNACYDVTVTVMKDKLIQAMYRPDTPTSSNTKQVHIKSAVKQAGLDTLITFSDVEHFLKAWEVLHFAHYLVTNACKSASVFNITGLTVLLRNTRLFSTINRVIQDMLFLADVVKAVEYRKEIVFHLNAAVGQLKLSMKLLLEHFNTIRVKLLGELMKES